MPWKRISTAFYFNGNEKIILFRPEFKRRCLKIWTGFKGCGTRMEMAKVTYLKSAMLPHDFPKADRPEVAISGRSNAGKSSFLNALAGTKVAKVSQTPGKTRLLNFFDFGNHYRFVDMPGYGYASRSQSEMDEWTKMIEDYLEVRDNLIGVVLLMDCRRDWQQDEEMLVRFCESRGLRLLVVLTKGDKVARKDQEKLIQKIHRQTGLPVYLTSAEKKWGLDEVEEYVFRQWVIEAKKGLL
jgi:GTP-binding protein